MNPTLTPASGNVATRKTLGPDGEWVETQIFSLDGKEVTEAEFRAVFPEREGVPFVPAGSAWPMRSDALACHPSQIAAMMERNKQHGVTGVSYDPKNGTAILGSRKDRKRLNRVEGFFDKAGGYGD